MHIAARTEVVARAADHDDLDVVGELELREQIAQFCVRLEGQRVLAIGPIECECRDASGGDPAEVRRAVGGHVHAIAREQRALDAGGAFDDGRVDDGVVHAISCGLLVQSLHSSLRVSFRTI
jgi:hypothetical protein